MKKLLALFVIIDFIFIGLIIKLNTTSPTRMITSTDSSMDDLTDGQKNKWTLIKTFNFEITEDAVSLKTDMLQMICETSSLIEFKYLAQNVAFAGSQPAISHTFSCEKIKEDQNQTKLITPFSALKKMHNLKSLELGGSQLRSSQVYSDEEFPLSWQLDEIKISGENTFSISKYEIEKVLSEFYKFEIPTSAK